MTDQNVLTTQTIQAVIIVPANNYIIDIASVSSINVVPL